MLAGRIVKKTRRFLLTIAIMHDMYIFIKQGAQVR